ncbi:AAA-domain-containing protein [Anaeromyces robustus]|uniref:Katanin p60 ATPase-containing subunit A-like 2 n=1 Tax=Anaeromyces robustus TaxID=1754192 RepID=A0A1Y1WWX4_9FUNG|nr:AAA-domain-containing protein [Anaeromyces robustus]|eukprot:ORX77716.1 AAA-domain-containing protein [Anaeromyces robustus]
MSTELSYVRMKISNEAKLAEENKIEQRKKNLLVLILDFLQNNGYINSVERLQTESNIFLNKVSVADNVDLMMILQEYETYYNIKFGKKPKFIKKNTENLNLGLTKRREVKNRTKANIKENSSINKQEKKVINNNFLPKINDNNINNINSNDTPSHPNITTTNNNHNNKNKKQPLLSESSSTTLVDESNDNFEGIVGKSVKNDKKKLNSNNKVSSNENNNDTSIQVKNLLHNNMSNLEDPSICKLLKPLPSYGNEYYELASIISRDIYVSNPDVKWDDIAGLDESKRLVKEAVVLPIKYPELFTGILQPWKGLLLFGPPGTGKTMLAKAVATECHTTFFNISASSIVSKWRGDSEKLVRVLFELAKYHAPSTIFLDELEAIMSQRTSDGAEHEGSRRMKTELLVQLDGLSKNSEHIFFLAASNLPWDLDTAMLRRLEKRILINLPDFKARKRMFEINLPNGSVDSYNNIVVEGLDYDKLAEITEGYSGSDIKLVCKEAAMIPVRKIFSILENMDEEQSSIIINNDNSEESQVDITALKREPVQMKDIFKALSCTKPSCPTTLSGKYLEWQNNYGSF